MINRVRFLTDENFRLPIVQGIRKLQPSIDILTISDAGLSGTPDPDVLVFAAQEGRVLLSHDVNTMTLHFANMLNQGQQSAGVILIRQTISYHRAIEAIYLVWAASAPEDWVNVLDFLPYP
jgi:predicted nuclease of predicted toxin-antitoxin system